MTSDVFKYKNYLTVEAQLYFDDLVARGFDPDLALAIIELEMDEEDIYLLPEDE